MKKDVLILIPIFLVIATTLYIAIPKAVDAQVRYKLDTPVTHIKFFTSNDTLLLSTQFNKFIVEKEFSSSAFELQEVEVIEFDSITNQYSIMVTYTDNNEEIPDRVLSELERNKPLEIE